MIVRAKIEMPAGTSHKYEIKDNVIILDRVLNRSVPYNYGYIPDTLAEDNDPLDIFVISDEPIVVSALVDVVVIGLIKCTDNGERDDKIIAVVPGADYSKSYSMEQIKTYLKKYKKGIILEDRIFTKTYAKFRIKRCQTSYTKEYKTW